MTKQTLVDAILSRRISGYTLIEKYEPDADRKVTFYKKDGVLLIAFYGTKDTLSDWKADLDVVFTDFDAGTKTYKSGRGFTKELVSLMPKVRDVIVLTSPTEIFVTGHSQGGAHATLCFAELLNTMDIPIYGSSFEAPMVLSETSARKLETALDNRLNCSFYRYLVPGDPVPSLPGCLIGYDHAFNEKKLENPQFRVPSFKYHMLAYIDSIV